MACWAPPVAWVVLVATGVCAGRLPWAESLAASLVVLAAVGAGRALARTRGGLLGRAAELALLPGAVAALLADPMGFRRLMVLVVAWLAAGLALAGGWGASHNRRHLLALAAAAAAGAGLLPGFVGTPLWGLKWALVAASLLATTAILTQLAGPLAAGLAAVVLAGSLGPAHTMPWLLVPLTAIGLLALDRDWPVLAAAAGAACAVLPPAGLVPGLALILGAALASRDLPALVWLPAAALLGWWRRPEAFVVPGLPALGSFLPVGMAALPFVAPVLVLGLIEPARDRRDLRLVLGLGLLLAPALAAGDAVPAAAAALWLAALPGAARSLGRGVGTNTVPFSAAASVVLLCLAPWGGVALPSVANPVLLTLGWTIALLLSLSSRPLTALAWLLPAAGLVWSVPVEGVDRHLDAGERIELTSHSGAVFLVRAKGSDARERMIVATVDGHGPLLAGRDAPLAGHPPRHPMLLLGGSGRSAWAEERGLATRSDQVRALFAERPLVVRTETAERWRRRRARLAWLLGGALALLAVALALGRGAGNIGLAGVSVLMFGALAAGSGIGPLSRLAFRGAVDLAALTVLAAWVCLRPRLRSRFAAGALLLVPLALAQPLVRHPAGDEVYHLTLMQSLVQDNDLDLTNNLDPNDPAQAIYLEDTKGLIHSPVLGVLLLPGFAAAGAAGALVLLALGMAWALSLAAGRGEALGLGWRAVEAAWLAGLLTYPALTFAVEVWPAAVGALCLALALVLAARNSVVGAAAAAAASVAVKVRLGLLTGPVALATALRRRRGWLAVAGLGAAGIAVVVVVFGSPLGRHSVLELLPGSPKATLHGLWGLTWDPAGGLAFAAPLWLVALAGCLVLWRRGGAGERAALVGAAATLAILAPRGEWYGGGSPPARYLVPLLPVVVLLLAAVLHRRRGRRIAALVLPVAVLASWVALTRPLWWFNPVDGGWWLADGLSRALHADARRVFPSLLRPSTAAVVVPLLLMATVWLWSRRRREGAAAIALVGLALAVGVAAGVPEQRVQAEDPQVVHSSGEAVPPPGTFARWTHRIAWRLEPGGSLVIPWKPLGGRKLWANLRVDGAPTTVRLSWDDAVGTEKMLTPGTSWRWISVPRSPRFGRHQFRFQVIEGGAVLVDRVEAR